MDRSMTASPFLLGFDHLERLLERSRKTGTDGYPPYDIEERESGLTITLAVAGFSPEALSVTVEGRQLAIRGRQTEAPNRNYLHRGIAARQFQKSFVLADGIEVASAALEQGLLKIDLARPKAEPAVRTIRIKTGG